MSQESFRITWHRVQVVVELDRAGELEGALACPDGPQDEAQQLHTLLNSSEQFLPFLPAQERPVLVNRERIVVVRVVGEGFEPPEGERRPVNLVLLNDQELEGSLLVSAPMGHTRTQDVLNDARRFVYFESDGKWLLVNTHWVMMAGDLGDADS